MAETVSPREPSSPPEFVCPISLQLMKDPVVVVETGQIYDRESIEKWFRTHSVLTDPLTGQAIKNPSLSPVPALRNIIEQSHTRDVSDCLNTNAIKRRTGGGPDSLHIPYDTPRSDNSSVGGSGDKKLSDGRKRRRQVQIQILKEPESVMSKRISKRFKIAFTGPPSVGKTSLIDRMKNGDFNPRTTKTIGVDLVSIGVKLGESLTQLDIWDTAGEERFMSQAVPLQLRGSRLICLVYDLTRPIVTLRAAEHWLKSIRECITVPTIFLLGNKSDYIDDPEEWENALDTGQAFADKHELMFFVTSAKTGSEVEAVLIEITRTLRATSSGSNGNRSWSNLLEDDKTISLHERRRSQDRLQRIRSNNCCSSSVNVFCEPTISDNDSSFGNNARSSIMF